MGDSVYRLRDVSKRFRGVHSAALSGVSLDIPESIVFGILGDNGAGKTTLVKLLVGLYKPTTGQISYRGSNLRDSLNSVRKEISFMPQSSEALNRMTVREALQTTSQLKGLSAKEAKLESYHLMEEWQLEEQADKLVMHLSGGQRRLTQIAVTLTGQRQTIILDEPTNDLDPRMRKLVWTNLRSLNRSLGTTVIFITHDVAEAEKIIDSLAILRNGSVVKTGTTAEVMHPLKNVYKISIPIYGSHSIADLSDHFSNTGYIDPSGAYRVDIGVQKLESEISWLNSKGFRSVSIGTMTLEDPAL